MSYLAEFLFPVSLFDHGEHGLGDVEGVVPVVIGDGLVAIVLLHGHDPPAKGHVVDAEAREESQVGEHSDAGLFIVWRTVNQVLDFTIL